MYVNPRTIYFCHAICYSEPTPNMVRSQDSYQCIFPQCILLQVNVCLASNALIHLKCFCAAIPSPDVHFVDVLRPAGWEDGPRSRFL